MAALSTQIFGIIILRLAILVFKKKSGVTKSLTNFFKDIWNGIDLFIIILSIICVFLMFFRVNMLENFIRNAAELDFAKYIPCTHLTRLEQLLLLISLIVITAAFARSWKCLRCGRVFRIMECTLLNSFMPLLCSAICHVVLTAAFALFGMVLFGAYSTSFEGTMGNTIATLLLLSVNLVPEFSYESMEVVPFGIGHVYLVFFFVTMLIVYNIYKTIVIMSYSKAKQQFSNELALEYTTKDYIVNNVRKLFHKQTRLRGGYSQIKQKVFSKADEFRFANGFFIASHYMNRSQYIILSFLTNILRKSQHEKISDLSKIDEVLIVSTLCEMYGVTSLWDTKELFFKGQMAGQTKIAFVDEKRITQIEYVVTAMLLTKAEREASADKGRFYERKIINTTTRLGTWKTTMTDALKVFNNIDVGMNKL